MQSRVEHRLFLWDFSNEARWRDTCQTQSTFLDEIMNTGGFISQIWSIPGFTINGCIPDFMHCVDLGITQSVCGNITWEIIRWLGGSYNNWQTACGLLLNMVALASKNPDVPKPFNTLTIGMVLSKAGGKPQMKLKAAEGRHSVPVLKRIVQHFLPMDGPHALLRYQCLDALHSVYLDLEHWQPSSPMNFEKHMQQHLLLYAELCTQSTDKRKWSLTPKHHLACHLSFAGTNPRELWNYLDETEIGKCGIMASNSNQIYIPTTLMQRYRNTFRMEARL